MRVVYGRKEIRDWHERRNLQRKGICYSADTIVMLVG